MNIFFFFSSALTWSAVISWISSLQEILKEISHLTQFNEADIYISTCILFISVSGIPMTVCLIHRCLLSPQWPCTESHPSMTWQSSPAPVVAHQPRVGARRPCSTEAKLWARTSPRSPSWGCTKKTLPPAERESKQTFSSISGSGLAISYHTHPPDS